MTMSEDIMDRVVSSEPVTLAMSDGKALVFPAGSVLSSWETGGMLFVVGRDMVRIFRKADIAAVKRWDDDSGARHHGIRLPQDMDRSRRDAALPGGRHQTRRHRPLVCDPRPSWGDRQDGSGQCPCSGRGHPEGYGRFPIWPPGTCQGYGHCPCPDNQSTCRYRPRYSCGQPDLLYSVRNAMGRHDRFWYLCLSVLRGGVP